MLLGEFHARGRLVEPAVYDVLHRVRQCKIGVIRQHSARECAQERLDRLGMPVKYQTERVICKQPRRIHPIARRLQMSDRVNRLAVIGKPVRGQSVQPWDFSGRGSPQLQAQQLSEQLVVPKPGTFGVHGKDERVRVFQVEKHFLRLRLRLRAGGASHEIS